MPKSKPETKETTSKSSPKKQEEKSTILATGLEDYGRWKVMFKDHKRKKSDPPFRRGRIWA